MASNSTSSSASTSTSTSTAPSTSLQNTANDAPPSTNGEQGGWGPRKKAARGVWPASKAEPVSGLSTARSQALPTPSSGQSAASTMNSAMHQPSPILPSQNRLQAQSQQNGSRMDEPSTSSEPSAILALLPMTGTFTRKQISVPYYPDVLRIGRQTNQKTLPTAINGYFDSKVLSRQHAEVWAERNGKIWIRDVKSSNGTFVNGTRLSPENRDSEPHELREQDTLELGIDIVSEDQKSIVHHKVSAKVELAGIYPNPPSLLEMDLNHNNPAGGNGILGEQMTSQLAQMRGRGGSQGSIGSNGRVNGAANMTGNNLNLMNSHRQMNMWMGPITIEQVVKKLTTELRSAKQHSQDLERTGEFFTTLMNLQPGEEPPQSPPKATAEKQMNSIPPPAQLDPISPFSQPLAPPPQQPLPEKPDVARFSKPGSPSLPPFKRADTERQMVGSIVGANSPTRVESGQIMSLVEELKIKTYELDSKVDYIKSLEGDLAREKRAREYAERRALELSGSNFDSANQRNGAAEQASFGPPLDSVELMEHALPNGHVEHKNDEKDISRSSSISTLTDLRDADRSTEDASSLASRLQAQLDLRNKEMNEMKILMESYRQRTEEAEEGRRSLAEMVENIRAGRDPKSPLSVGNRDFPSDSTHDHNKTPESAGPSKHKDQDHDTTSAQRSQPQQNGSVIVGNMHREIEKTMSNVLQQQQRKWAGPGESMAQNAPYISMVGVVLIGVGIMTWLNGWQPGGEK
ncbi:hypothetical protein ACLMJK_009079 [Lecanora helva]